MKALLLTLILFSSVAQAKANLSQQYFLLSGYLEPKDGRMTFVRTVPEEVMNDKKFDEAVKTFRFSGNSMSAPLGKYSYQDHRYLHEMFIHRKEGEVTDVVHSFSPYVGGTSRQLTWTLFTTDSPKGLAVVTCDRPRENTREKPGYAELSFPMKGRVTQAPTNVFVKPKFGCMAATYDICRSMLDERTLLVLRNEPPKPRSLSETMWYEGQMVNAFKESLRVAKQHKAKFSDTKYPQYPDQFADLDIDKILKDGGKTDPEVFDRLMSAVEVMGLACLRHGGILEWEAKKLAPSREVDPTYTERPTWAVE